MNVIIVSLVQVLPALAPAGAAAPTASAPALISSADRAGDAAIQSLIDATLAQAAGSGRRLSSELATLADAERAVREFISRTARLGPPHTDERGHAGRRATIETAQLNLFLTQLAARDPYLLDVRRLRLTTAVPQIVSEGWLDPAEGPFDEQPGWRHCSRRDLSRVRAAVAEDLRLNLLVSLCELRTAPTQGLGELLAQDEAARRRLQEKLATLPLPDPALESSGVCRMRLVLTRRQTIALLESALGGSPDGGLVGIDWPRLTSALPATLTVEGFAVAPPGRIARPASQPAS